MASKADKWKISEVSHDCAGAAAFVWLLFARQQANARGPWEVYDAPRNDGELMTRLAPSGGGQSTTASRLLAHLLASGETEAARTSREILPSLPARSETAASSERRATLLHQEAASDSKERSQESVGPERSAGHGSMKWFAVGFVLLMTVSLTSWLSKTRDFKPIVQEAVRRITDEADQGVSSITEARSKALKQIEEKSKSLLEHIDESTRVAISLDPPEPQGCDEDREIGRMAIQKAGDRALLYICTPEEDGWLQVGQRPKVERAARPQPAR